MCLSRIDPSCIREEMIPGDPTSPKQSRLASPDRIATATQEQQHGNTGQALIWWENVPVLDRPRDRPRLSWIDRAGSTRGERCGSLSGSRKRRARHHRDAPFHAELGACRGCRSGAHSPARTVEPHAQTSGPAVGKASFRNMWKQRHASTAVKIPASLPCRVTSAAPMCRSAMVASTTSSGVSRSAT